jgi:hypothetical protein
MMSETQYRGGCVANPQGHRLAQIKSTSTGTPGAQEVVRWCCDCGAVVIDVDVDGRTHNGEQMEMHFPSLALRAAETKKAEAQR